MMPYAEMLNKMRNITPMETNPNRAQQLREQQSFTQPASGEVTRNGAKVADCNVGGNMNVIRFSMNH